MQSSKQTPSVIARLMGLDDLPSQPRIHKQHRVLSENYLRKTASIGQCEKSVLYSGRSYRVTNNQRGSKNGVEEEIPVIGRNSFQSISDKKVDSSSISTKMCSIKQQSGGAKHPLIEQRLHHSKEFDNVPEDLHFNQDKLLRYLQQPDLLQKKQLQGQQSHELHFSGHSRVLNSSSAHSNRKRGFCNISKKATTHGSTLGSLQKLENDTLSGTVAKFDIDNLHKQLISRSDLKAKTQLSSTRIVVLTPNSRKALISERSISLPGANGTFLSGDRKNSDFLRAANEEESSETTEKERRTNDLECSRQNNRALEKFDVRSAEVLLRGEECSSEFESKLFTSPSQRVNNLNNIEQNSYSSSNRSDLAMLAKRQIFERWKTTKSFEEGKFATKRCTLGEMLDISDMETNPKCLSNKLDNGNLCSLFSRHNGKLNSVTLFGISRKVGGKVEKRILPQSKLHLQHCSSTGSRIFRARSEASHRGRLLRQQEADDVELNNKGNQSLSQKCNLEPKDSIIIQEKPQFSPSLNLENQSTLGDCVIYKASSCCNQSIDSNSKQPLKVSQVIQDEIKSSFGRDDMSGNTRYFSDVLNSSIGSPASCVEEAISVDAHSSDIDISSSEFKELHFDPMPISLGKDDDTLQVWETSDRQESLKYFHVEGVGFSNSTGTGPVFQMNLRETNETSPNSVLDPPFQEENVYIFQGFDSAAADFYSPPKRLQLQMSESEETCSEGTGMAVSSDEDTDKESVDLSQDSRKLLRPFQVEESRNFSYVVDVLDEAGFTAINLEKGFGRWHSLEFPVSPSVFEALEKKYGKQTSWQKSERRLLFDQINAGLKEILNLCNDVNKWAKPLRKRFHSAMRRDEIVEDLWSLISEEKEACKDLSEKALGMETKWLQLSEEKHEICRDIENDLFDELVGELAATEEFIE